MKTVLQAIVFATTLGFGITNANAQADCGDGDLCIQNKTLKSWGYDSSGIQKGGIWASCHQVGTPNNESLARTTGQNRARAQLQAFLAKTEVAQWFEKELKVTFVAGYQRGIGAEKIVPFPINGGKQYVVCVQLKKVD